MSLLDDNIENIEKGASLIKALSHPLRLQILAFIHKSGKVNVNKIYRTLKLEQSITSQQLKILRDNKIVSAQRNGQFIFYTINYEHLKYLISIIEDFIAE